MRAVATMDMCPLLALPCSSGGPRLQGPSLVLGRGHDHTEPCGAAEGFDDRAECDLEEIATNDTYAFCSPAFPADVSGS
jgi:hypothetical protein